MLGYKIWKSMTPEQKDEYIYRFGQPNKEEKNTMRCFRDMVVLMLCVLSIVYLMIITAHSLNNHFLFRSALRILNVNGIIFLAYCLGLLFSLGLFPIVDHISIKQWLDRQGLVKKENKADEGGN